MTARQNGVPRPAGSYRGARRNAATDWPGFPATYRPYMTRPPIVRYAMGIPGVANGTVVAVKERKQARTYPAGWRTLAERAARIATTIMEGA